MPYPSEAEQEAFTAGWNAAMALHAKARAEVEQAITEAVAEHEEIVIEAWIRAQEKAPGRV